MGSSCRTCGTALPPWHRTYAHSGFYSAGRKTHCRESRLWRSLRSTYRSAARVPSASPSPCRKDAYNISKVTCLVRKNHYYHALLVFVGKFDAEIHRRTVQPRRFGVKATNLQSALITSSSAEVAVASRTVSSGKE